MTVSFTGARGSGQIVQGAEGVAIGYDAAGQRVAAAQADGTRERYTYSADGWLQDVYITPVGGGEALRARRRADALGRTLQYIEFNPDGSTAGYTRTSFFDRDNRLTEERTPGGTNSYLYYNGNADSTQSWADAQAGASATGSGQLARIQFAPSAAGTASTKTYYTYEYWDSAQQRTIKVEANASGVQDWKPGLSNLEYNVNGYLKKAVDEAGGRTYDYFTNATGLTLLRTHTKRVNGSDKTYEHYYYYAAGRRVGDISTEPGDNYRVSYAEWLADTERHKAKNPFKDFRPVTSVDFDQNYEPINERYPAAVGSNYTVRGGESLSSIARAVWGDAQMWYLIAEANGLTATDRLTAGQVLIIPNKVTNIHNNAETFRPYSAGEVIGHIDPTLPDPPPPPAAAGKKGCGGVGMILVAVVAIAVTVVTAGAAAAALAPTLGTGVLTSAVAGTIGAVAGSIAGQAVGLITGVQDKFSWKQVGLAAVGGAVGGALFGVSNPFAEGAKQVSSGLLSGSSGSWLGSVTGGALGSATPYVQAGLNAAASNALGQGIGVATGLQDRFSWRSVAASAVGAGVGAAASQWLGGGQVGSAFGAQGARFVGGVIGGVAGARVVSRSNLGTAFYSTLGNAIGNSIVESAAEQGALKQLAEQKGFDLSKPSVADAVLQLYRHQQGSSTLSPSELRTAMGTVWASTGASVEQVAENLATYDRAGFTADRRPTGTVEVGPLTLAGDDFVTANQIAGDLARQDLAAEATADPLAIAGNSLGSTLATSKPLVNLLASSGRVLKDVGGFIEERPWLGLSLEGLEIVAGPAMYAVRKGVDYIAGDQLRALAGRFNDGMVAGLALSPAGFSEEVSTSAALGATFFGTLGTGAVASSVAGLHLVQKLDQFGSKLAGPVLENLKGIGRALDGLNLPEGVQIISQGYSRLGTRGVAVLERTAADGSSIRVAAVLANGEDVSKLARIDWNELSRVQGIATDAASATLRSWVPSDLQRAAIQGALDAGDVGKAMQLYRMNVGTAQHGAIGRELQRAGVSEVNVLAGRGPDLPITRMRGDGIPLPLEFHPDSAYSFGLHVSRDYPSYLTIVTPKIGMEPFYRLFGKAGGG